jgi:CRISPR/Cas system-associated exonuclease Cas4 (RecB family)
MPRQRLALIKASEIGEYVYCAHAWWLRRVAGWEPDNAERLEHGRALHQRHGQAEQRSRWLLTFGVVLILGALGLLVLGQL